MEGDSSHVGSSSVSLPAVVQYREEVFSSFAVKTLLLFMFIGAPALSCGIVGVDLEF